MPRSRFLGSPHQLIRIGPGSARDLDEFGRIEPSFAELHLRDKRLPLAYPPTQLFLRHAGILPSLHE